MSPHVKDHRRWVIERRNEDGTADFSGSQPESYFGMGAIHGMDTEAIAKAIFRSVPGADLHGDTVASWPSLIDPRWLARLKTW